MIAAIHLEKLLVSLLTPLGYELVDMERQGGTLRIFVEKIAHTITVDDCVFLTRQLEHVFLVEKVEYSRLEVSSPGLDRVIKKMTDYKKFVGARVHVRLHSPIENGKRVFALTGQILSVEESGPIVKTKEGEIFSLSLDQIRRARLVPE